MANDPKLVVALEAKVRDFERQMARAEKNFQKNMDGISQSSLRAEAQVLRSSTVMTKALGAIGGTAFVHTIRQIADSWSDMQSRVGAAVNDMDAAPELMKRMVDIANASYSPLAQTVEIYSRNVSVLGEMGRSANEAADFTESLNHMLVMTATKGERAASVQNALSKAMAVGKLNAEGLEAVLANGGRVAQALATELGTTVNGLRSMASDGKITGTVIANAIIKPLDEVRAAAGEMPATIEDAYTRIVTNTTAFVGQMDKAFGASGKIAEVIIKAADNIDIGFKVAGAAALVFAAHMSGPLIAAQVKSAAAATSHAAAVLRGNAVMVNSTKAVAMRTAALAEAALADQFAKTIALEAAQADLLRARNMLELARAGQIAGITQAQASAAVVAASKNVTAAQTALTSSSVRATAAVSSQSAAMAANTVAARAMAVAGRAASSALALIGGPAGAAILAIGGALYISASRAQEAQERSDRYASAIRKAGEDSSGASGGIRDVARALEEVKQAATDAENAVSLATAQSDLAAFASAMGATIQQLGTSMGWASVEIQNELQDIRGEFLNGQMSVEEFNDKIDNISRLNPDASPVIAELQRIAREAAAVMGTIDALNAKINSIGAEGADQTIPALSDADFNSRWGRQYSKSWEELFPDLYKKEKKSGRKGGGRRGNEWQREVSQIQERTAALQAETAAQAQLNPLVEDYDYTVTKARAAQELLTAAQRAGVAVTPELLAQIAQLAEGYAQATVESKKLAESQDDIRRSAEEMQALSKDVLGGFIDDLIAGKSAAEALSGALKKIGDKLLDMALNEAINGLFSNLLGGGGGLFGSLFGGSKSLGAGLFSAGGYTGTGGKYEPAGVVHKGEVVWSQDDIRRAGGVGVVEAMRRGSAGYAGGGVVAPVAAPIVPQIPAIASPAVSSGPTNVNFKIDVSGARGNAEIMEMVQAGVSRGIEAFQRSPNFDVVVGRAAQTALSRGRVR